MLTAKFYVCVSGNHIFRPLVDNNRETSLSTISSSVAADLKRSGADRFVHCQLQQQFRILGTPMTAGFKEFDSYPLGRVYKSKLCADKNAEVECKFRVPKIIGNVRHVVESKYIVIIFN